MQNPVEALLSASIGRRQFLQQGTAVSALPVLASTSAQAQTTGGTRKKVIVIGAGMAGLAAADKLSRAGLVVTVLEAKGVVGGRVYTERSVNGIPMDLLIRPHKD